MTTREELEERLAPYWEKGWWPGLDIGDGWLDLVDSLVTHLIKEGEFTLEQVKEKFGGLRFYANCSSPEQQVLIDKAEDRSYQTCETCGTNELVTVASVGSWTRTLCHDDLTTAIEALEARMRKAAE
jgi:hypothetical protein